MLHSLSRHVCAGANPRVPPGMLTKEVMSYVLIGWRTHWCDASQTTNQSGLTDWLIMHPQCILYLHYLFIYLFKRLQQMIAVMAKVRLNSSFVFSSWYKRHPFVLQIGWWCCNSALHFQSAQRVNDYTSHQHVVGFSTPFSFPSLYHQTLFRIFFFFFLKRSLKVKMLKL